MIHFSKHTQHFNDKDKELVSISTEGKTIEEIEIAFQKFLRACGFEIVLEEEYHEVLSVLDDLLIDKEDEKYSNEVELNGDDIPF